MTDNAVKYGVRWSTAYNGGKSCPGPEWKGVASGYQASPNSVDVDLNVGDLVELGSGGNVQIAVGNEATQTGIYGVIVAIGHYWDGSKMVIGTKLPGATTWGTVLERRSKVGVVPITAGAWEIDVTGHNSSYDTETEYLAAVGGNADFTNVSNATTDHANPRLDITDEGSGTAQLRILAVSGSAENQDFSGAFVKMIVTGNEVDNAPWNTTGV